MAESWVFGGNDPELGRGLNHLPYAVFIDDESGAPTIGVGIGACVLDLRMAAPVLPEGVRAAAGANDLGELMAHGQGAWAELREALQFLLSRSNKDGSSRKILEGALLPERGLRLELPVRIGDYTDFYASREHAWRVGEMFRPEKPLLENYDWVPIGYHGRASSIVASGNSVRRPAGQRRGLARPEFGATEKLDYELELGLWVGSENELGTPVPIAEARERIFGVSLLNDWSARDVQAWEYQPLGPFLGKNFATTVSPWVTPLAALEGMRVAATSHEFLLDYLNHAEDQASGGLRLKLQVGISTRKSRAEGLGTYSLSEASTAGLYWTMAQMVAHHTSGGCNLRGGDLLGTGTVSGPARDEGGCLLELTRNGAETITLANAEVRTFLEDGDEVVMTGFGEVEGELPVRLGECRGRVVAAPPLHPDRI